MTVTLKLRADSAADIERAAAILRRGGIVAFPTETVYGLGANALDSRAVARIFEAKQRPAWDPLIVHMATAGDLPLIANVPEDLRQRITLLAEQFWPGPLTILLPKAEAVPASVTAGRGLVGVRVPRHAAALALLQAAGVPLAAPSANTFGHTSPTTAAHVLADLDGRIDAVLDGGPTTVGVESTVIDPTTTPVVLYRPGAVTAEQVSRALDVEVSTFAGAPQHAASLPESLPSPGVGIRHYAPRAKVFLVSGNETSLKKVVSESAGKAGVLLPKGWTGSENAVGQCWGDWNDPADLAANLFASLRALDERDIDIIYCPLPASGGLNDAIRDRLEKAARTQ